MPTADVPLRDWTLNFTTLLTGAPATYGLTAPDALVCANAYAAYDAALALVLNPGTKTSVTVAQKNYQRALMRATIMPFAVSISQNGAVDPGDKVDIGVTVRIPTRTRASIVDIPCELTIEGINTNFVSLRTQNPDTPDTTSRPYGTRLAEVQCRLRNAADTADELTTVTPATRRFVNVATPPLYAGRRAYYRARWVGAPLQGGAANNGAWSDEVSTILP
jgi:hypothetical protein